jgi:hypothetical protein
MKFQQRVTKIKDLSDRRRLPRLGSIRLGIKKKATSGKEYPAETHYFVCPPEVQAVFGEKPTELEVMFPLDNIEEVFPQAYKYYGSSKGLKCQGDGELAYCAENGEMIQRECPCELYDTGKCKQSGTLMVIIPKVSVGGVYQIRTSSYNSIVDVNSGLDYVRALVGRFCMIPLKLRRVVTETHHDEKKQNHYTLQVIFDSDIQTLNALISNTTRVLEHSRQLQLPAPLEENPEMDPVDITDDEDQQKCEYPEFDEVSTEQETRKYPCQSQIEAKIAESGMNRERFKEWMFSLSMIQLKDGKPSMSTITEKHAKYLVDKWSDAVTKFNTWNQTE